jgi:anaerobic ribonucleoside-triphosphate reductase activating protein
MSIRLASSLQTDSIVDGNGIRTVIWTQGCAHRCPGCHNPETHDFSGGCEFSIEQIKTEISALELQEGITFSGGDPFYQPEACAEIAAYAKSIGLNIWCYTGFTFEALLSMAEKNTAIMDFMENIDIMVDGPFQIAKRSYSLKFRGSHNQRVIDVKQSLASHEVVLANLEEQEIASNYGRYEQLIYI